MTFLALFLLFPLFFSDTTAVVVKVRSTDHDARYLSALLRKEHRRLSFTRFNNEVGFYLPPGTPSPFFTTKAVYNGSFSGAYNGLFVACARERSGSYPCTPDALTKGFWLTRLIPSWILSLVNNCVGFTSHDLDTMGMCIQSDLAYGSQLIQCSCEIYIYIY